MPEVPLLGSIFCIAQNAFPVFDFEYHAVGARALSW